MCVCMRVLSCAIMINYIRMCLGYFIFLVFSCDPNRLCSNFWLLVLNPLRIYIRLAINKFPPTPRHNRIPIAG